MIRLPDDMFPYRVPVTTTKSQKNLLPTAHTECKVNIDQPDPNHEKACTIPDKEIKEHDVHAQMLCLREKVKERLSNSDDYQSFLKCIAEYCTKSITRPQLQSRVNSLLGVYLDIVEEANEFIDHSEKTRSLWSHGHLPGVIQGNNEVKDGNSDEDEIEKNSSAIKENYQKKINSRT
ncbi:unnamed protein product [Lactuca saligna]|uniref:Histone deacetylase interacting domain-containing protein n=1 Tax=Lactuca saligna TaxID=75948 RepID=A0AA35UZE9_LACSI|nr:unnamed protein product [Lactuca saligna]